MQNKTLSEKIAEIEKIRDADPYDWILAKEALNIVKELQTDLKRAISQRNYENSQKLNYASLCNNLEIRLGVYRKENQALLAKSKELEDELETRRAFIVANPCAQCGGKINAMKCGAWHARAKELEEKYAKLKKSFD